MTPRTYASPEAFKQALEQRLRSSAKTGAEFARKRQLLVFDRFLARIVAVLGDAATLKGGLVLELRLERARTTSLLSRGERGGANGSRVGAVLRGGVGGILQAARTSQPSLPQPAGHSLADTGRAPSDPSGSRAAQSNPPEASGLLLGGEAV